MISESQNPPSVPDGVRVYAIGDVHGRLDLLERLFARIAAERAEGLERQVLVLLGDYVDRGTDSAGVVRRLLQGPPPGFEMHLLKGNHEAMLLDVIDGTAEPGLWFVNGGLETAESYGVEGDWQDLGLMAKALRQAIPDRHLEFLRGLKLSHREGDYAFVHAGVRPGLDLAEQREEDLLWIRDGFLESRVDFGAVVVHGHSPVEVVEVCANRIGIDTRAWQSGQLTALVLEGEVRRFLST